jgi:hypothetical protein
LTDYLKLSQEAFEASTSYLDTNLRADWEYGLKAFRNEHAPGSKYLSDEFKSRSRIFSPKTRTIIRKNEAAAMQAAFSNREVVNTDPGNPDDAMSVAAAAALKEVLEYRLSKTLPAYEIYIGGVQDAQTTGTVCSYQYWEYQKGKDGKKIKDQPCIELRPVENLRLDAGASWIDPVNTSPYFCDIIPMYVCDVRAMMEGKDDKTGAPKWKKLKDEVILKARPDMMDTTRKARLGQAQDPHEENQTIKSFDVVWVMRWFMRNSQGEDQTFYTLGTEELLTDAKPIEEVYFHGKRPYVMGYAVLETHKAFKTSVPTMIRPLVQESNDVRNQRLDNVKFVLNKRWIVARGRQVDVQSLVRNVPGGVTLATDPKNDVQESNWPDVTSSSFVEHDRINSEMDDLAGNFSASTKVANNAVNDTLGGSKIANSSAGLMTEYLLHTINTTWWERVLRQLALLEQYYETDEVVLSVCAQKARLFPRFGLSQITDDLMMKEVTVSVNMAMGDPTQRLQKFMFATQAASGLITAAPPGMNIQEAIKEIYSNAGYRDGGRFFNQQQDPRLLQAMQMVQKLQGALQGKQMEMRATAQLEQAKLASNERIKGAEIQVNQARIQGDLQIRQTELIVEQQKLELEKLKIQAEQNGATQEIQFRAVELQAKIEEGQKKIEHERLKLEAEIRAERESAVTEVQKLLAVHEIKTQGLIQVAEAKRAAGEKAEAKQAEAKEKKEESAAVRESAAGMHKDLAAAVGPIVETLKNPPKKKITLIKKDGRTIGAEVTTQ